MGDIMSSPERARWLAQQILPHEPALRGWLRRRQVNGLDPDDIVQETYAVLAGLPGVAHIVSPRAYAFQTAQSIILRHLRRARVVRIDAVGDASDLDAVLDAPSPEQQAAARQDLRFALAVIAAMPPKRRQAFTLRKIEGLSQREIARRMGISESTVEKHIGHALHMLMDAVKQAEGRTEGSGEWGTDDEGKQQRR
jgi:RNA polymerase sigma factor (sigma-70 family)